MVDSIERVCSESENEMAKFVDGQGGLWWLSFPWAVSLPGCLFQVFVFLGSSRDITCHYLQCFDFIFDLRLT